MDMSSHPEDDRLDTGQTGQPRTPAAPNANLSALADALPGDSDRAAQTGFTRDLPEQVVKVERSFTGAYLAPLLAR
ncbi:hypothetical protein [Qipengyuania sp.]|uniref:hypothetical protein n=1 Tax=Qipengyuania sp. TaxID=2004515 RepID=UPI0035C80915